MKTYRTPNIRRLALALLVTTLAGCASTTAPVVYPSAKPQAGSQAEADLKACRTEADAVVGVNGARTPATANRVAQRGAVEFVDKAVETLVVGSKEAWAKARGAGAGAAAGTLTSVALNWNEPDSVYRNYVEICLKERGHRVLGWR